LNRRLSRFFQKKFYTESVELFDYAQDKIYFEKPGGLDLES
jgi:hypothetical protein